MKIFTRKGIGKSIEDVLILETDNILIELKNGNGYRIYSDYDCHDILMIMKITGLSARIKVCPDATNQIRIE